MDACLNIWNLESVTFSEKEKEFIIYPQLLPLVSPDSHALVTLPHEQIKNKACYCIILKKKKNRWFLWKYFNFLNTGKTDEIISSNS